MEKVYSSKQIKLFKKVLGEFSSNYNLKNNSSISFKVRSIDLKNYSEYIEQDIDSFVGKNTEILAGMKLFQGKVSPESIPWAYIQSLYFICSPDSAELLSKCKSVAIVKPVVVPEVPLAGNSDFNNMIGDISARVAEGLKGQDLSKIDPMALMNGLMSGNTCIGGFDFSKIIEDTTKSIKEKVSSGELDPESLKTQATGLLSSLNLGGLVPK